MKFKNFSLYKSPNFHGMNRANFLLLKEEFSHKEDAHKYLKMDEEHLIESGFYKKFTHLKV